MEKEEEEEKETKGGRGRQDTDSLNRVGWRFKVTSRSASEKQKRKTYLIGMKTKNI